MTKPIEKGFFVHIEAHPEYGVGRVLAVGAFATRVLFPRGGLRVFRAADTARLKTAATPPPADVEVLDLKEAALNRGEIVSVPKPAVAVEVAPAKKKRAAKKA